MKKILSVLVGLVVLGAVPLSAFEKGDIELSPVLRISTADNLKTTDVWIEAGYHLEGNHQISASYEYRKEEFGQLDITGGFLGIGYDYNLMDKKKNNHLPFIGVGIKLPQSDFKDIYDRVLYIHGGFKSFLVEDKLAVRTSLDIEKYTGKGPVSDDTSIALRLGLIFFFKKK